MIKRLFSAFSAIIFTLSFCACKENGVKIINAENMQGAAFDRDISGAELKTKTADTFQSVSFELTDITGSVTDNTSSQGATTTSPDTMAATTPSVDTAQTVTRASQVNTTTVTSAPKTTTTAAETTIELTKVTTTPPQTTQKPPVTSQETYTTTITALTKAATLPQTTAETKPAVTEAIKPQSSYIPINYEKTIGVWISYLELAYILKGKSETDFRKGFSEMMDNCISIGINTVYIHVRPFGDAVYKSELFPWSSYVTGTLGNAPSFDPLTIMLEEAHSRNISFHAWINPMRLSSAADISKVNSRYPVGEWYIGEEKGTYLVKSGDYWYLNPGYDDVTKLVADGAYEIVSKYNVDGLHIDDYFYPTTDAAFDYDAFSNSSMGSLSEFRLNRSSKLVKEIYNAVKKANPKALFGISPQGSVENNYNTQYADVKLWSGTNGYCDYIAPQIYYGFENSTQPYVTCLALWHKMTENSSVKLIPGLALYKIGKIDTWAGNGKNEWINNNDIIKRQIQIAKEYKDYSGIILYSYNYLFNDEYVTYAHKVEIEAMLPLLKN